MMLRINGILFTALFSNEELGGSFFVSKKKRKYNPTVVISVLIFGLVVFFFVASFGSRLLGYQTFPILNSEMSPQYRLGSLAYVKQVNKSDIIPGTVISYREENGSSVSLRRVQSVSDGGFETVSDMSRSSVSQLVLLENVIGAPVLSIPFMGYFAVLVRDKAGLIFLSLFLILLFFLNFGEYLFKKYANYRRVLR